jgi:sister-chromatid-cohesion protein PDS5
VCVQACLHACMMSKQRELDLTDIGKKLANAQSKEALMNLLPQAASMLEDVEQSPPPSTILAMKGCSDALVDPTLLGHKDKDVGVLVALCISEIMRIVAPDAPYSDDCLKEIFQLIVGIFRGLDDVHSPSFSSRVNILETVAKVRSCVVMLDLDCDDLITEMFEIFFTTISDKHPEPVFLAMRNVLSLVINEGEEVSSQILEVMLNNLLRQKEGVSQAGHMLAVAVVEESAEILDPYVQQFFILAMSDGSGLPTALKKDYHELIYELYCCAPQMVQGVLPYLKEQLVVCTSPSFSGSSPNCQPTQYA